MYKKCSILTLLFVSIYIQLAFDYKAYANITKADFEKANLNVGKHAEFIRIVLAVPSEEIAENISVLLTDSKLIKIVFSQPLVLTFNRSGVEQKIPAGEGFFEITKEIKALSGTNFCLIQAENLENYKLTKMTSPPRIVIDIYTYRDKSITEPAKPSIISPDVPIKRSFSTFVIDPGHGGHDKGINDENNREKDIVLNISKEMARMLTAKNKKVFLTRKADQRRLIKDRISFANSKSPDLFISIHISSHDEGFVYTYTNEGNKTPNDIKSKIENDIAINLINNIKKDSGLNLRHERLPLPLLMHIRSPALFIELPHFRNFSYDKKETERLVNAIIRSLTLTLPMN